MQLLSHPETPKPNGPAELKASHAAKFTTHEGMRVYSTHFKQPGTVLSGGQTISLVRFDCEKKRGGTACWNSQLTTD